MSLRYSSQKGLSLVELLIAMVLGLLLTAGALEMMLASRSLNRTTDDSSRIQENGRFALQFLAQSIRMAGYNVSIDANGKPFWDGACGALDPCTADGGGSNSDRIAVVLDPSNDADCLGVAVATLKVIANVYFVADIDGDGVSSLYCDGLDIANNIWLSSGTANSVPQPLVDGIENIQVLYGDADPSSNNEITRYISADQVNAASSWQNVGTVRIALLANNGQQNGNSDNITRNFRLLDATDLVFNDKHSRQAFTSTIAVNNILYQNQASNL